MSRSSTSGSQFAFSSKKEWNEAAKLELDGGDPSEKLIVRRQGLEILPYYDATDLPTSSFLLSVSPKKFSGPRSWSNLPHILVNTAKEANEQALDALGAGADGISFEFQQSVDPEVLLKKIEMPYCTTVFVVATGHEDFFRGLVALAKKRKYKSSAISGAIFWKSPPNTIDIVKQFSRWDQFYPIGIFADKITSSMDEIATLLSRAVAQIDDLQKNEPEITSILNPFAFSVPVETNFFLQIAKFKALRLLTRQIEGAYGISSPAPVFIHGRVNPWEKAEYQPHGNLIFDTTAATSAILGGCDGLTVIPSSPENGMTARVARNVSSILREESQLARVADPTAGSYYIDRLTDQIAEGAWKKFQLLVK